MCVCSSGSARRSVTLRPLRCVLSLFLLFLSLSAFADDPWQDVANAAELPVEDVKALLGPLEKQQSVLDAMAKPWERKPWHQYGPIFLNEERATLGVEFWQAHAATLAKVEEETGVPAQIIVAILGVETKYGRIQGNDNIAESLYTLGFYHSRRGSFFRKELGHYARIAHDEHWDVAALNGSYAGAMGMAQFMPSSYRNWAVDGDGDGTRDLFHSPADAIASVANYFVSHGWRKGEDILLIPTGDVDLSGLVGEGLKPTTPWSILDAAGVQVDEKLSKTTPVHVYKYAVPEGVEYRIGRHNFYVVTRYNHSRLYARAVVDLAAQLGIAHDAEG
ncbi:MAG: lytic murein transglycosylase B [Rhodobacterales bacterium]|nr:lytic murein transglycosylase B [Rhodobacterales bacterium]